MIKNKYHPFRKKWGQNFLVDKNLLERIARTIDPKKNDSFLEIGPGEGALTQHIFSKAKEMLAIEIDPLLIETLKNRKDFIGLKVINSDILTQDIESLPLNNPVRVIGNIPYNITSSIIFWLIDQFYFWEDAFIMMQKEVAKRLTSKVGTKSYGRLTVVAGAYLEFEYCFTIPPDVFIPKPKVESAFVRFTKKKTPLINDEKYIRFNKLVASAFSQRRKMLRNTLKGWDIPTDIKDKIDFNRRPETLTIKEFASLV
ncbi:MAG: 16S rRNA (adenine(1518)-N(6)/adenine(1519)-N(6))-dimethyltransferase RsmA [Candidatus Neomarinimicrobiota bacterium]